MGTPGTISRIRPSRIASMSLLKTMHPVALPPGLLMTKPAVIGSPPVLNTIGISDVAAFAAYAEASPPVATSTLTWRPRDFEPPRQIRDLAPGCDN